MDVTINTMLPKLQDEKLLHVGQNAKRIRKLALMYNNNANENLKKYDNEMDKEKRTTAQKMNREKLPVVKKLIRARGMQRCLAKRRKEASEKTEQTNTLGKYKGLPLTALRYEIESSIRDSNPRLKRLRKTQKLLTQGRSDGRLINSILVSAKFSEMINRPFSDFKSKLSDSESSSSKTDLPVKVHCLSITDPRRYVLQPLPVPKQVSIRENRNSKPNFIKFPSISSLRIE